jgi:nucleotide-binding universal stress UspA family protein
MWKILFATDGSDDAAAAAELLRLLPLPEGSSVLVLHVARPPSHTFQEGWRAYELLSSTDRERAELLVARARDGFAWPGVDVAGQAVTGDPAPEILEAAGRHSADLVVVGSRGLTGLKGFFLGSVARNVAQHAACSVLVARRPTHDLREVILATDGSDHAAAALALAERLPLPTAAHVTAVSVVRPYAPLPTMMPVDAMTLEPAVLEVREQQQQEAQTFAAGAAARLREGGRAAAEAVALGDPAEEIALLAESAGADLIIAGARGVSAIESLLLGSVADRLLTRAHCSVLIAR